MSGAKAIIVTDIRPYESIFFNKAREFTAIYMKRSISIIIY